MIGPTFIYIKKEEFLKLDRYHIVSMAGGKEKKIFYNKRSKKVFATQKFPEIPFPYSTKANGLQSIESAR